MSHAGNGGGITGGEPLRMVGHLQIGLHRQPALLGRQSQRLDQWAAITPVTQATVWVFTREPSLSTK